MPGRVPGTLGSALICAAVTLLAGCTRSPLPAGQDVYPEQVISTEEFRAEARERRTRLSALLARERLERVCLHSAGSVDWVTAGFESEGATFGSGKSVRLVVGADGSARAFRGNGAFTDGERRDLALLGLEPLDVPWFEPDAGVLPPQTACDSDCAGGRVLSGALEEITAPVTAHDARKFRWIGKTCASVVENACRAIRTGATARGVEIAIRGALLRRSLQPERVVVTCSGDGSGPPAEISGTVKLAGHVVVRAEASRWGLTAGVARHVHFGDTPAEVRSRIEAAARVNAGFWARTLPGARSEAIFRGAVSDYSDAGFPDAWRARPLGGAAAYGGRTLWAGPSSTWVVRPGMVFLWTPRIGDLVVADTILVSDRLEVLTQTADWPRIESRAGNRVYRSPGVLELAPGP